MEFKEKIFIRLGQIESLLANHKSPWLTVGQGADYLGYSGRHVRRLISQGRIKAYKAPGGGIRLHRSDMDSFIMYGLAYSKLTRPQKEAITETRV